MIGFSGRKSGVSYLDILPNVSDILARWKIEASFPMRGRLERHNSSMSSDSVQQYSGDK